MPPAAAIPRRRASRRRWIWLALAAAACAPFAAVFVQSSMNDFAETAFTEADRAQLASGLEVFNPTVAGRTEAGEPFVFNAVSALPDGPTPERVRLQDVTASTSLRDGRTARLAANSGMLYVNQQRVALVGGVRVETSDGAWLVTDTAILDTRRGSVATEAEVHAAGPVGRIRADRLDVLEDGGRVAIFKGGVRMTVQPGPSQQGEGSVSPQTLEERTADEETD